MIKQVVDRTINPVRMKLIDIFVALWTQYRTEVRVYLKYLTDLRSGRLGRGDVHGGDARWRNWYRQPASPTSLAMEVARRGR